MLSAFQNVRAFAWTGALSLPFLFTGGAPLAVAQAAPDAAQAMIDKANIYIELIKSTERAVDSWERYRSWVNMKTGPTGKERYITYGMYDLHDNKSQLKEARAATAAQPKADKIDAAMLRYVNAYEALEPVMRKANSYYERKAYIEDKMVEGKALHGRMLPLATAFLAERDATMPVLRAHVHDVEQAQLDAIEKMDGRNATWHVGRVMHAANGLVNVFPRIRPQEMTGDEMEAAMNALGPDTPSEKFDQLIAGVATPPKVVIDVGLYGERLEALAAVVADFEKFNGEKPDDFDDFSPFPKQFLDIARAFQKELVASKGLEFEGGGQMVGRITEVYFGMLNAGGSLAQSQLRYLP